MDTPEYKTFTQCYPDLVTCVEVSPTDIGKLLKPSGILAPSVFQFLKNPNQNDDVKAGQLLSAVEAQVKIDAQIFYTFLDALKAAGTWTKPTVTKLEEALRSHKAGRAKPPGLTVESIKEQTGVTDTQLDKEIAADDLPILAGCFGNYNDYLDKLSLTRAECADVVRTEILEKSHQSAMREALRFWRKRDQSVATFKALLNFAMGLGKHQDAIDICNYIVQN